MAQRPIYAISETLAKRVALKLIQEKEKGYPNLDRLAQLLNEEAVVHEWDAIGALFRRWGEIAGGGGKTAGSYAHLLACYAEEAARRFASARKASRRFLAALDDLREVAGGEAKEDVYL